MVINLRDNALKIHDPSQSDGCRRFSGALVSGAYARPFEIDTVHETSMLGVHFRPGGAFPFLGLPAGDLADAHVDLDALWGARGSELRERLCGASTPEARFRRLEDALLARLRRSRGSHPAVPAALRAFLRTRARVEEVARSVGLSKRLDCGYFDQSHLIRDFVAFAGISPMQYAIRRRQLEQLGTHIKRNHLPLGD